MVFPGYKLTFVFLLQIHYGTKIHKLNILNLLVLNSVNIFIDIFVSHYYTGIGEKFIKYKYLSAEIIFILVSCNSATIIM